MIHLRHASPPPMASIRITQHGLMKAKGRVCISGLQTRYSPHWVRTNHIEASANAGETISHPDLIANLKQRKYAPILEKLNYRQFIFLRKTLRSFVPESWDLDQRGHQTNSFQLQPGYHLTHFNPAIETSKLLPDGTDDLYSPGLPFSRRLWAGGLVKLRMDTGKTSRTRDPLWICREHIKNVTIKGSPGGEKIFVSIERLIGKKSELKNFYGQEKLFSLSVETLAEMAQDDIAPWRVIEQRDLVFMRPETAQDAIEERKKRPAGIKPAYEPDYSHTFTPTPALLFRFSALTFNTHAIHLDPHYAQTVEGHRDLLFHGPLSLTFLMTMLHHERSLSPDPKVVSGEVDSTCATPITSFEYRNLAPLYVNEPLTLCAKRKEGGVELWIQNEEGDIAVKGRAKTIGPK